MQDEQHRYFSFLLRLRQATSEGSAAWRVSIENARTGERRTFPDLASLFAFLEMEVTSNTAQRRLSPAGDTEVS